MKKGINNIEFAFQMKMKILDMCYSLEDNAAHLGGCFSLAELLTVLYNEELNYNVNDLQDNFRDRVIMSKGQGSIALYAAMFVAGLIRSADDLKYMIGKDACYFKQSVRCPERGIEFSSGSLGQGLSYAVGIAIALKRKCNNSKIYVFVGDGECDEGSVWEAAALASHMELDNIVLIVDRNRLQIDGWTDDINSMKTVSQRLSAFGFDTVVIDGHDFAQIKKAYQTQHERRPLAIIADTIKGNGISFAMDNVEWHQNYLTEDLYNIAKCEVIKSYDIR